MPAQVQEERQDRVAGLVREVRVVKTALEHVLREKAMKTEDKEAGAFYYVVARILSSLEVKYHPDPSVILATDGRYLYVGPGYDEIRREVRSWDKIRYAAVLHEALHVVYAHPQRMKLLEDPTLFNTVADLLVNTIIEKKLRLKMPKSFVTLETFPLAVATRFGIKLSEEQLDAIQEASRLFLEGKLTAEDVYRILMSLGDNVVLGLRMLFAGKRFAGHDLLDDDGRRLAEWAEKKAKQKGGAEKAGGSGKKDQGKRREKEGGDSGEEDKAGKETGKGREKSGAKGQQEQDSGDIDEFEENLKKARDNIRRVLDEIHKALGEYKAVRHVLDEIAERTAGHAAGVIGRAEYEKLKTILLPLEIQFLREVEEAVYETRTTYTRFDDDAYWLPAQEEDYTPRILILLDSSPSIGQLELLYFLNLVKRAVQTWDVVYEISVFSVGEVAHLLLDRESFTEDMLNVPRGAGTRWDKTIAERIRKAREEGVQLIQVLSDFHINVEDEVLEEIKNFKANGGKVSCFSVTEDFLDICDYRHRLPTARSSILRRLLSHGSSDHSGT